MDASNSQARFDPPGLLLADNSTPTPLNFDSHLLGDPSHVSILDVPGEDNQKTLGFPNCYQRTGIVSESPMVGYGASNNHLLTDELDIAVNGGRIWGSYDILPAYQSTSVDVA